ncbi:MAG: amidophosphoribosyltransferase [Thermoleophilia bacterium]|nr:amidophosphoribosyltransferase [Thermoleophilia bacterium]
MSLEDSPKEECGVVGIVAPGRHVARLAYFALHALQHRGQESAGIAVADAGHVMVQRDLGLVSTVFTEPGLRGLQGDSAIGHVRYSTTGGNRWENAQPVVRNRGRAVVAVAHNGNLTNTEDLRSMVDTHGEPLLATTDSELMAAVLAAQEGSLLDAACAVMPHLVGAYSVVCLTETETVAFRDPHGVRPLVIGRLEDGWCVASETCALDQIGAAFEREVRPGEAVRITATGVESRQALPPGASRMCVFENIYFARPDTLLGGRNVWLQRQRMGAELARCAPADADLVVGLPDSGTPAAIGFARESGIPYGEAVVRNRYVGRSFIQPDQELRREGVKLKFNPLREVIEGRRLVVVDDSIVRGTTTKQVVQLLRDAGAAEVHMRISSPPVAWPCFYGIDMPDRAELIAAQHPIDEVADLTGCTSLAYLPLDALQRALETPLEGFCHACFSGDYPIPVPSGTRKLRLEREPDPARA